MSPCNPPTSGTGISHLESVKMTFSKSVSAPITTAEPTCQQNDSEESCENDGCVWCESPTGIECGCLQPGTPCTCL